MYQYDLTSQKDQKRLWLEAEELGREAARTMPLAERSDVIRARAQQLCERALSASKLLTNDVPRYTASFIDAYTNAYFQEIVVFFHENMRSSLQQRPGSQTLPP